MKICLLVLHSEVCIKGLHGLYFEVCSISLTIRCTLVASSWCRWTDRIPNAFLILFRSFLVSKCILSNFDPTVFLIVSRIYCKETPCISCPAMAFRSVPASLKCPRDILCLLWVLQYSTSIAWVLVLVSVIAAVQYVLSFDVPVDFSRRSPLLSLLK